MFSQKNAFFIDYKKLVDFTVFSKILSNKRKCVTSHLLREYQTTHYPIPTSKFFYIFPITDGKIRQYYRTFFSINSVEIKHCMHWKFVIYHMKGILHQSGRKNSTASKMSNSFFYCVFACTGHGTAWSL